MNSEHEIDAAIGQVSGGRVLDVATGYGYMIQWMINDLKDYESFVGIDAVDIASRKDVETSLFDRADVTFMLMDAHHMTFENASFDTVTIGASLHHLDDPRQVFTEIGRVLKPGGRFIFSEMYRDNQTDLQMTHVLMHHWWAAIDSALGVPHRETYTRAELVAFVESLGLRDVQYFDYADLDDDPKEPERMALLKSRLASYLDRAKDLPNFADLQAQADALARRLDEIGQLRATQLTAIGRK